MSGGPGRGEPLSSARMLLAQSQSGWTERAVAQPADPWERVFCLALGAFAPCSPPPPWQAPTVLGSTVSFTG